MESNTMYLTFVLAKDKPFNLQEKECYSVCTDLIEAWEVLRSLTSLHLNPSIGV